MGLRRGLKNVVDLLQDRRSKLGDDVDGFEILCDLLRLRCSQNHGRSVGVHSDPGESEAGNGCLEFFNARWLALILL